MIQVFSRQWFQKHQRKLVWFANTKFGRYVLRIHGKRSDVAGNKIVGIMPNAITWAVKIGKKKVTVKTEFRTHDKFAKRLYYAFKPIWWLLHGWDWVTFKQPRWNLGFDTLTQYPGSTAANNPCDGIAYHFVSAAGEVFATMAAAAGSDVDLNNVTAGLYASTTSNKYNYLYRGVMCFDTSALTADATLSAATLSLYCVSKEVGLGDTTVEMVSSAPANAASLAAGDYDSLGSTSFGNKTISDYSASAYNDISLNASGLANISLTSVSKFGAKLGWDQAASFGGTWSSYGITHMVGASVATTGTGNEPKLVVTYSLSSASAGAMLLLGIG